MAGLSHLCDLPAMSATEQSANGPFQDQNNFKRIGSFLNIVHFNAEGLSKPKCECLSKVLLQNNVDILALQETHIEDPTNSARGNIPGYRLVDAIGHRVYGVSTYVRQDIDEVTVTHKSCDDDIFVLAVKVSDTTIVNIYKPPNIQWADTVLPAFEHPVLFVGDFNSHHSQWGYSEDDENGKKLTSWAEINNYALIFDAKDKSTFFSARWRRGYSPDLCFCSCERSSGPMPTRRKVLGAFPHSQHRPVLISMGTQVPIVRSFPRPRWNFSKADWQAFSSRLEQGIRFIPPLIGNYDRFTNLVLSTASKCIPRGYRKEYIPGWSRECEDLFNEFKDTESSDTANELLQSLNKARREKWVKTTESLNFTHSSRRAWSLLRKLSSGNPNGNGTTTYPNPSDIAKRIVNISKSARQPSDKQAIYQLNDRKRAQQAPLEVSRPFAEEELETAITALSIGKAAGLDNIYPEFLKHTGSKTKKWLLTVFNAILATGNLPMAFKRSKIVAVLKPGKNPEHVESYRPIALLSVCFKLLERMIYNRISPILDASIPVEQAGFRPGRNCCDQVLSLTSFIEKGFDTKTKTSTAFIDLSSAYDTVWRKGLLLKFYNLIPCPILLRLLDATISSRLIKVCLGRKESSFRHLNDGLPQGSVLSPLLFNVYIADIPATQSRKFIYADDIALATQHVDLLNTEVTLTKDLATLKEYFRTWKLRPNPNKTEVACFHLNNRLANQKLNIYLDGVKLKHNEHPQYLGVTLDRSLTFKSHLQKTAAKVRTRNNILQQIAGSSWGADAQVLRTTALSLVYSAAEYCAPVWLNSAHVREVDVQLNRAMRIISGTLLATPLPWLPVLCNIAPPEIRRKEALVREVKKILSAPRLPITEDFPHNYGRLKSRQPPLRTASQLVARDFSPNSSWAATWDEYNGRNKHLVSSPPFEIGGMNLPRKVWTLLNRFRSGVGRCNYWKLKWGLTADQSCDCGADIQTMEHIVTDCPLRCFPGGLAGLHSLDEAGIDWLASLDLAL